MLLARHVRSMVAGLTVMLALATPAMASDEARRLAEIGKRIVTRDCARCHAVDREGASPLAAAPPFRTLSARYPVAHLAEAFAEGITTGHPDMPEFVFETDEIDAILAYLEAIGEAAPPAR